MSLKEFHVVFITASVLLSAGFAWWGIVQSRPLWAVLSVVAAVGLGMYEVYFMKKTRALSDR